MTPSKNFLVNSTRKKVLSKNGRVLRGLATGLGAMFRGLPGSFVLVWHRSEKIAITNIFVFQTLDIIWVDEFWRVADLKADFKPWSLHAVNKKPACYVLELPAGTISRSGTRLGDRIICRDI